MLRFIYRMFTPHERKIGLVGTGRSGKSILMLSIINHLEYHMWERFRLGVDPKPDVKPQPVKIRRWREVPVGQHRFNYEDTRAALIKKNMWPPKSQAINRFRCQFERSDWNYSVDLEFVDFPGERFGDATMMNKNYTEWSAHMLEKVINRVENEEDSADYQQMVANPSELKEGPLLACYKRLLAKFATRAMALVSPSTFLMDSMGRLPKGLSPTASRDTVVQTLSETRYSGLSPDDNGGEAGEFAPLPLPAKTSQSELYAKFQANYDKYRSVVVQPVYQAISGCDRIIATVDVPTILASGMQRLNDERMLMKILANNLKEPSLLKSIINSITEMFVQVPVFNTVRRTAFVATKADLVHEDDQTKLKALLENLTRPVANDVPNIQYGWFVCSAAVATQTGLDPDTLVGVPSVNNPDLDKRAFRVPRLPGDGHFPQDLGPSAFPFVRVEPPRVQDIGTPPPQRGVDRMLEFIMA